MNFKINYIEDDNVISTVVSGNVTLKELADICEAVYAEARKTDTIKLISDYRNATIEFSVMEIYELPETLNKVGRKTEYKTAVVYSKDAKNIDRYNFLETRFFNTATNAKIFTDYDEAYKWLLSSN